MADEMEEVTQAFEADMSEYTSDIEEATGVAADFAGANEDAKAAVDGLRDSSAEAGEAIDGIRDKAVEAKEADDSLRDSAIETATALGHLRDEALEASEAMKGLRDSEVEAGAAGDAADAGGLSMMAIGITALIGLLAAVAPAVAAIGLAVGGFAVFAIPTITQVTGALGDTKAQLAALSAPIRDVVNNVKSLENGWKSLSKAFQPEVLTAVDEGLQIAGTLMQEIAPIAMQGAFAVNQILLALQSGVSSKGFTTFLSDMSKLVMPATNALIGLAGTILGILGNALEQLAPYAVPMIKMLQELLQAAGPALIGALKFIAEMLMDIGKVITPILGPLGKLIGFMDTHPAVAKMAVALLGVAVALKVVSAAQSLMSALGDNPWILVLAALVIIGIEIYEHWRGIATVFDIVRHAVAEAGHEIAEAFDIARHAVAEAGHDIASAFDTVRHTVATIGNDIIKPFEEAVDWIKTNWKLILSWLVDPIGTAVFEIRTHVKTIEDAFTQLWHDILVILKGLAHDIEQQWDEIRHQVAATVDAIPKDIEKQWDTVRHDAAALGDDVLHLLESAWHSIWSNATSTASTGTGDVVKFFEELPGRILHELEALPGQMLTVGKNIVLGVLHGVEDIASDLLGEVKNLAGDVEKAFTDPLSILSPSMVMFRHGQNYVQGIIDGVKSKAGELRAAAGALGTGLAAQGPGSSLAAGAIAPASGGTTVHVQVPTTVQGVTSEAYSSPQFQQYMQSTVQEAVLRYGGLNPNNGFTSAWGR